MSIAAKLLICVCPALVGGAVVYKSPPARKHISKAVHSVAKAIDPAPQEDCLPVGEPGGGLQGLPPGVGGDTSLPFNITPEPLPFLGGGSPSFNSGGYFETGGGNNGSGNPPQVTLPPNPSVTPDPGTWLLMTTGFGIVGYSMRTKKGTYYNV